jgi:ascorbate-specific PTS system EIIC-type component UlaA
MSFWEFLGAVGAALASGVGAVIGVSVMMVAVTVTATILTAWMAHADWRWSWKLVAIPAMWAAALFILLLLAWTVSLIDLGAAS